MLNMLFSLQDLLVLEEQEVNTDWLLWAHKTHLVEIIFVFVYNDLERSVISCTKYSSMKYFGHKTEDFCKYPCACWSAE